MKMIKKIFNFVIIFSILAYTQIHVIDPQIGSFETERGWTLWPSTTKSTFVLDKEIFKEGKTSAKITIPEVTERTVLYCYIPMKEGKKYEVKLWFKTQNLIPDSNMIKLQLAFNLKGGPNASAGRQTINFPSGYANTDWKEFIVEIVPPAGTDVVQFAIDFSGTKGIVWIDSVRVIELRSEEIIVKKVSKAPIIDGKDEDDCWQNIEVMNDFFVADFVEKKAEKQTYVKMCYDDENLYFYFKCEEANTKYLVAKVKERDGDVWNDDCIEIFLSPEINKTYHFIINSLGVLYDAIIIPDDKTATGYKRDNTYNSNAKISARIEKTFWAIEMSLPFSDLNKKPLSGETWNFNFAREDKVSGVNSSFSRLAGSFYQPNFFSKIIFKEKEGYVIRNKYLPISPLKIVRKESLFKELLTSEKGNYTTYMWYHSIGPYENMPGDIKSKFTKEDWEKELWDQLETHAKAGFMGLPLPWAFLERHPWEKEELWKGYYEKYGTRLKCCVEHSGVMSDAIKKGAEIVFEEGNIKKCSLIDPVYINCAIEELVKWTERFKDKPYVWTIEGKDEPYIYPIRCKISEMSPQMKKWNDEVLKNYGFGKYGIPAINDDSYWQNKENHPFQWIAFFRWASDKWVEAKKRMYEAFKKSKGNSHLEYVGADYWFMSGFVPFDYSLIAKYTDYLQCDPYASSAERREGRGIYNHGFGTKLLKDLGNGKPVITVCQAFNYAGYTPTPDDLKEWVSQALKMGACRIEFYENMERYRNPALYNEMIRLSKVITTMNKVNIPDDADTAIIVSLDSEAAKNVTGECLSGDEIYTAYSILGEKVGVWFEFLSDRQIEREEKDLKEFKIIYLPLGKYMTKKVVEKIVDYVRNGGILVITDPLAFEYNIDGSSLAKYREEITGVKIEKKVIDTDRFRITNIEGLTGSEILIKKKGSIYDNIHQGYLVKDFEKNVKIIGKFMDDSPAIFENNYGKGKVIYFTANPMAPDILLIETKIDELFRIFQKKAETKVNRPIWKFLIP
ncbi:MAG: carbohydrate-binding family 9-like protein [Candidatus Omnitrophica bacterium]|nr:carbohydrate-binding family 9-like protein [Candidatus Omnitrophota bacterium]